MHVIKIKTKESCFSSIMDENQSILSCTKLWLKFYSANVKHQMSNKVLDYGFWHLLVIFVFKKTGSKSLQSIYEPYAKKFTSSLTQKNFKKKKHAPWSNTQRCIYMTMLLSHSFGIHLQWLTFPQKWKCLQFNTKWEILWTVFTQSKNMLIVFLIERLRLCTTPWVVSLRHHNSLLSFALRPPIVIIYTPNLNCRLFLKH